MIFTLFTQQSTLEELQSHMTPCGAKMNHQGLVIHAQLFFKEFSRILLNSMMIAHFMRETSNSWIESRVCNRNF
jgi:hypothetical protein